MFAAILNCGVLSLNLYTNIASSMGCVIEDGFQKPIFRYASLFLFFDIGHVENPF